MGKRLMLNNASMNAVVVANCLVTSLNMIPGFQHTGTWYDYATGNSFEVNDVNTAFYFEAGEYHIYTDQPLPVPDLDTSVEEVFAFTNADFLVWPNPANSILHVVSKEFQIPDSTFHIVDTEGRILAEGKLISANNSINVSALDAGIYFLRIGQKVVKWVKE